MNSSLQHMGHAILPVAVTLLAWSRQDLQSKWPQHTHLDKGLNLACDMFCKL